MKKVLLILILCNWNLVFAQNFPSDSNLLFLDNQLFRININISQSSLNSLLSNSIPSDLTKAIIDANPTGRIFKL